jgi:protein-disulfide isomerase
VDDLALPVGPRDHVRGRRDAPITLVEYADVECPYCGSLERVLQKVLAERDDIRLVYRHFPLVGPHPHAYSAALALESAAEQGRFWELHDLLLAHQDGLGRQAMTRYAQQLGLDPDSLLRPATERFDADVRDDFDSGVASGVEGTPGLFVNGVRLRGKPTFERILDAADA